MWCAGNGATNYIHCQGRHHSHSELQNLCVGSGQPPLWQVTLSCIPASPSHSCRLCQFQCMAVFTCCFDPVCLPAVCLSVCLPVSVRLSVSLSVHSACLSSSLSVCLSVCLSACLSVILPACLPICKTDCLPACLCMPASLLA